MNYQDFLRSHDYKLPEDQIATHPLSNRSQSKLLMYEKDKGQVSHGVFHDIASYLGQNDVLVFNRARVSPVRVFFQKPSGGKCEVFFLRCLRTEDAASVWEVLLKGKKLKENTSYILPRDVTIFIQSRNEDGSAQVRLSLSEEKTRFWLEEVGVVPLPPYIIKQREKQSLAQDMQLDRERYQSIFSSIPGSAAAPTASLHFSEGLLSSLREKGVSFLYTHLQVGLGTFQPLTEEIYARGKLHSERVDISKETAAELHAALQNQKRIIAVGTTVLRALEYWYSQGQPREGCCGECDLFLKDPWRSNVAQGLITNFHLPQSSLMALVSAFLGDDGPKKLISLYEEAKKSGYRFYSYGDAMILL